jgi:hypothetical protein
LFDEVIQGGIEGWWLVESQAQYPNVDAATGPSGFRDAFADTAYSEPFHGDGTLAATATRQFEVE